MQYTILTLIDNEVSTFQSDTTNRVQVIREFIKNETGWTFSIINKHKIDIHTFEPDHTIRINNVVINYSTIAEKLNAKSDDIVYIVTVDNDPSFAFTRV